MKMIRPINVLIVNNDALLVESLVKILIDFKEINCVGCAYSGKECIAKLHTMSPDIILMDIRMETPTAGIDAASTILMKQGTKAPKIIFFTAHTQEEKAVVRTIKGADILDKNINIEDLVAVIKTRHHMHRLMRTLPYATVAYKNMTRQFLKNRLSPKQFEVYCYLVKGFSIRAIAEHLLLLEAIVRTYRRNIFARLADFGVTDNSSLQRLERKFELCAD